MPKYTVEIEGKGCEIKKVTQTDFMTLIKVLNAMNPNGKGCMTPDLWSAFSDCLQHMGFPPKYCIEETVRDYFNTVGIVSEVLDAANQKGEAEGIFQGILKKGDDVIDVSVKEEETIEELEKKINAMKQKQTEK
jgi:hypothetical protein